MKGIISNFRRGRHTIYQRHMIVHVDGVDSADKAKELVGKKVSWKTDGKAGKVLEGKVASAHGGKGAVRVIFATGMPGQCIGKEVLVE
jgi:ribosomal protein L35AE/L33A|tara:strand:- start:2 stop:265 length:264 start_codon:yes stop_codon:yes gene_type:complete